ncbi:TPA: exosporium protein D, partial [Bacillus cereus]|nr:exosporium protein D [Bacillus cereus]
SVVSLFVQKTFCICCNDNNDSCDEYYQECN